MTDVNNKSRTARQTAKVQRAKSNANIKRARTRQSSQLSKLLKTGHDMMQNNAENSAIHVHAEKVDVCFDRFKLTHSQFIDTLTVREEIADFESNFDQTANAYYDFKKKLNVFTKDTFDSNTPAGEDIQPASNSHAPSGSAKLNAIKAKRALAELKLKQITRMRQLELEKETMEIEYEIAQAKIEEQMWSEADQTTNIDLTSPSTSTRTGTYQHVSHSTSPAAPERSISSQICEESTTTSEPSASCPSTNELETETPESSHDNTENKLNNLADMLNYGFSLPKPELLSFDGSPDNYSRFMKNFECAIECRVKDNRLRLSYLIQYCTGVAKELIENCVLLNADVGYSRAKELLKQRFGSSHIVSQSCIDTVVNGPALKANDQTGLLKLSTDMANCELTLRYTGSDSDLNNTENLRKIVKRLPTFLRRQWVDKAHAILKDGRNPTFSDLAKFIGERVSVLNSVYGQDLAEQAKPVRAHDRGIKHKRGHSSYPSQQATMLATQGDQTSEPTRKARKSQCRCCDGECKTLSSCDRFKGLDLKGRRDYVKRNRLCFNCLIYNHVAKECKNKNICTVPGCHRKHHTLLHQWQKSQHSQGKNEQKGACNATVSGKRVCLRIVPVRILGEGDKEVVTYALLDEGSEVTLCTRKLLESLGIQGKQISFNISTVNQLDSAQRGQEVGLNVCALDGSETLYMEKVWSVENLPISAEGVPTTNDIKQWPHLVGVDIPVINTDEVGLLIGSNVPEAFWVQEQRRGGRGQPYAVRSPLGWSVFGPMFNTEAKRQSHVNFCHTKQVSDNLLHDNLMKMYREDFNENHPDAKGMSREDIRAYDILENSMIFKEGHYHLALPWRNAEVQLPNNRATAYSRLMLLKKRLQRDTELYQRYSTQMESYISQGYAERVDTKCSAKTVWYLPHHPVTSPNKPGKVRIVFDCSAKYNGRSLNSELLQGPDLINNLAGVLLRFRQENIAIVADIEAMFHQVKVNEVDRGALRFLWWADGDLDSQPEEYRMAVHLFGATSSPSCSAYALKRTAIDNKNSFSADTVKTVDKAFYVDDLLKSVSSIPKAINMVAELRELLSRGGFNLTKWISNSKEVLNSIPESDRAPRVANMNLGEDLPMERALGVSWNVERDTFVFNIKENKSPLTRRGILSTISTLFDPLGLVAPINLKAKAILQQLCKNKVGWDQELPQKSTYQWLNWLSALPCLSNLSIARCYKPQRFKRLVDRQLHLFSDASEKGYGACAYLRLTDKSNQIHTTLVMGKSRVAPIKATTIPRLELQAAVVACRMNTMIKHELQQEISRTVFWTDSNIVLGYINNERKRFKTFVANRLAVIHDNSDVSQWQHVPTEENPADMASRGIDPQDNRKLNEWLHGPEFLRRPETFWPAQSNVSVPIPDTDKEVRCDAAVNVIQTIDFNFMKDLMSRYSDWYRLQKAVAWLIRFKNMCCVKYLKQDVIVPKGYLTVEEIKHATHVIIRNVQRDMFPEELKCLANDQYPKSSKLAKLCPYMEGGLMRVGGRISSSTKLPRDAKHQIILPKRHHVTDLIVRACHLSSGHMGSLFVLSEIRRAYWIVHGLQAVKSITSRCIQCKRQRKAPMQQRMAPLPQERVEADKPPFTFTGVDYFGPFYVKYRRAQAKRYGVLFTCLTIRAVHIEIAHSLTTDSFMSALFRFMSRRGKPEKIFSDNGTNLVSGHKEINAAIRNFNQRQINDKLLQRGIEWHFNPPNASHMGGIWERLVRSIRKILGALIKQQLLTDEALLTYMAEVERILNDRPIAQMSNDPSDMEVLTPSKLLLFRDNSCVPPGIFDKKDAIGVRRWRQIQYLSNVFWRRWTREYLPTLQARQKWTKVSPNIKVNDIVLVIDENLPRGQWPLALVTEVHSGRDGLVRSCDVRVGSSNKVRPITKLCLLEQS